MYIFHSSYATDRLSQPFLEFANTSKLSRAYTGVTKKLAFGPKTNKFNKTIVTVVPQSFVDMAALYASNGKANPTSGLALNRFAKIITAQLVGFNDVLKDVVFALSKAGLLPETKLDEITRAGANYTDVFGIAMIKWLERNRQVYTNFNDIVFMMLLVRENLMMHNHESEPVPALVATGYAPDLDWDSANSSDVSVGLFQCHTLLWKDMARYMKLTATEISELRVAMGRMPWWVQAGILALDVQRASISKSWLRQPVYRKGGTIVESRYPYYLLGQPGLYRSNLNKLARSHYVAAADTILSKYLGRDFTGIAVMNDGIPKDLDYNLLFPLSKLPLREWQAVVAGCSTCSVVTSGGRQILGADFKVSIDVDKQGAGAKLTAILQSPLNGFTFDVTKDRLNANGREFKPNTLPIAKSFTF